MFGTISQSSACVIDKFLYQLLPLQRVLYIPLHCPLEIDVPKLRQWLGSSTLIIQEHRCIIELPEQLEVTGRTI
jgi:hypothetical protein